MHMFVPSLILLPRVPKVDFSEISNKHQVGGLVPIPSIPLLSTDLSALRNSAFFKKVQREGWLVDMV